MTNPRISPYVRNVLASTPSDASKPEDRVGTSTAAEPRNRVVLVTGAGGALGSTISDRLSADGWTVVRANQENDSAHIDLAFDVTRPDQWAAAVEDVQARWGLLCGLVLAHGVVGTEAPIGNYPLSDWEDVMRVNLTGCFLGFQATLPALAQNGGGRAVALASITAREPNANQAAYSVSKAGLIALVKTASKEYASSKVMINALAPGVIRTPMATLLSDDLRDKILSRVPMERFGEPKEVAAMASFLLSDDVTYTTGQVFDVSGGRAAI